jgi:membrane associated rhomboid family serine protease
LFPVKDNIPTDRFPVVTVTLIALNVIAYFLWQKGGLSFGDPSNPAYFDNLVRYATIPFEITHPGEQCVPAANDVYTCSKAFGAEYDLPSTYVTVFTAMFMHGGLLHLGGNMLFLWIFGNNVEDSMGPVRFLVFYLLAGIAALALQTAIHPNSTTPTLGASGAVAGVLGGYILMYPRARVLTLIFLFIFFTFIELPAFLFLFIWFAQQAIFGAIDLTNPTGGGGVAYFAHIGGFVFGLAAIRLFAKRRSAAYGQPKYPVY